MALKANQARENVGPKYRLFGRQDGASIVDQKVKRHTLNNANQGQLDLDDHCVELGAGGGEFHEKRIF
jgi:hypothetical protein